MKLPPIRRLAQIILNGIVPGRLTSRANDHEAVRIARDTLQRGDAAGALAQFQDVIDRGVMANEGYFGWGLAALGVNREGEAMKAFDRALTLRHPEAGLRLANMALRDERFCEARDVYIRVLDIAPEICEAHFGIGLVNRRLGRREAAIDAFQRAMTVARPHPEAASQLSKMTFEDAVTLSGAGRHAEAVEALRHAIELDPAFSEAELRLADLLLAQGSAQEATVIYRRILQSNPELREAQFGLGIATLQFRNFGEAAGLFDSARSGGLFPAAETSAALLKLFPAPRATRGGEDRRPLICVPILPFIRDWLGGQIYILNFARTIALLPATRRPRLVVLIAFQNWAATASMRELVASLAECNSVLGAFDSNGEMIRGSPLFNRYRACRARTQNADATAAADLFSMISWTFPMLYPSWGNTTVPRPLYWIPDFQHRFWPSYFTPAELMGRDRDMLALSSRNVPVIFSSRDAQEHNARFYPDRQSRSHVWHFHTMPNLHATTPASYAAFNELGLPSRFYYTPNQFWPHKDHETLFRGLRILLDQGHDITLVCTGNEIGSSTVPYERNLVALIDNLELGSHLRLLGVLPREVQFEVIRRACAIIQPSLFEGWSTVVEDARAFGRPLIVSDIPLHREQAPDAIFFDAQDPAALAEALLRLDAESSPGPDIERERAARDEVIASARTSAEQFLAILKMEDDCREP